jgi:hypothetical protein
MLCFSDRQPGDIGPRRVRQDEIRASFGSGWRVDSIEAAKIDINTDPNGAQAWHASITRTGTGTRTGTRTRGYAPNACSIPARKASLSEPRQPSSRPALMGSHP